MIRAVSLATLLSAIAAPAFAENSRPQPQPIVDTIPAAQDKPYPGTIRLEIDATDTRQGVFRAREVIPVARAGHMVLLFPKWLPGNHSTTGQIDKLAGLKISANGRPIAWRRDAVDMTAFHIEVPRGVSAIEVALQFVSATEANQGRVVMTPDMMNLQWNSMSLYPAGYFTRGIPVEGTVTYPEGWTAASALPAKREGNRYRYQRTDYETLVDSPVFAGRHFRAFPLSDRVTLNVVADSAKELEAMPEAVAAHQRLVTQAVKLFGSEHYDRYEFLLAISAEQGGIGLEHHRSSENGVGLGYFSDWASSAPARGLLPHEFTHSWNGKFRRGADLFTPDYRTPMRNSLLWVYEGQTQFWGLVLGARSGLLSKQDTLDAYAMIAAGLDAAPGRQWRPLGDTTNDPVIAYRRPKPWSNWQRSEDYYNEGLLVWMEVDSIVRRQSGGRKSMDDFARAFFGVNNGDWGEVTYSFDDVVKTLNAIQPYDWAGLLTQRLTETGAPAPLKGFEGNGYRLVYGETPSPYFRLVERQRRITDLTYSIGLVVGANGTLSSVLWDGPAFRAGMDVGDALVAVNGYAYSPERLKDAITAAKAGMPIILTTRKGERVEQFSIDYKGGLRYPRLEPTGTGEAGLDRLLAPQ